MGKEFSIEFSLVWHVLWHELEHLVNSGFGKVIEGDLPQLKRQFDLDTFEGNKDYLVPNVVGKAFEEVICP
jgi:hypothetical protein